MKPYNALIKKNQEGKVVDVVFLKEGFSWSAGLFGSFWFLYQKMWKEFFALTIFSVLLMKSDKFFGEGFEGVLLNVALAIIIALNANYWLSNHLKNKGYEFIGVVFGNNEDDARLRFLKEFDGELEL